MGNLKWSSGDDSSSADDEALKALQEIIGTSEDDPETTAPLPRELPPLPEGTAPDTRTAREALADLHATLADGTDDGAEIVIMSLTDFDAANGTT